MKDSTFLCAMNVITDMIYYGVRNKPFNNNIKYRSKSNIFFKGMIEMIINSTCFASPIVAFVKLITINTIEAELNSKDRVGEKVLPLRSQSFSASADLKLNDVSKN